MKFKGTVAWVSVRLSNAHSYVLHPSIHLPPTVYLPPVCLFTAYLLSTAHTPVFCSSVPLSPTRLSCPSVLLPPTCLSSFFCPSTSYLSIFCSLVPLPPACLSSTCLPTSSRHIRRLRPWIHHLRCHHHRVQYEYLKIFGYHMANVKNIIRKLR